MYSVGPVGAAEGKEEGTEEVDGFGDIVSISSQDISGPLFDDPTDAELFDDGAGDIVPISFELVDELFDDGAGGIVNNISCELLDDAGTGDEVRVSSQDISSEMLDGASSEELFDDRAWKYKASVGSESLSTLFAKCEKSRAIAGKSNLSAFSMRERDGMSIE